MSIEDTAVVEWIRSFDAGASCETIDQLWDGVMLAQILQEIVPESFTMEGITVTVDGKWVLAAKNIRTILKSLDEYFTNALAKKVRVEDINENDIAKNHSTEEVIKLVELIVGVAVFCEHKQVFIGKIFELSADSQSVLKGLVQHVMESAEDLAVETSVDLDASLVEEEVTFSADTHSHNSHATGNPTAAVSSSAASDAELLRAREMLAHMQQERSRLLGDLQSLEGQNEALKQQLQQQQHQQSHQQQSNHQQNQQQQASVALVGGAEDAAEYKQRLEHASHAAQQLRRELDETKSALDLRLNEVETLRQESRVTRQKWEASVALQTKAEMEARAALDELDLARAKADRLFKVEQQLEKAQTRLEEMLTLRRTNKELNDRLDASLDKIHDLESSLKEVSATQRNLEAARAKNIEMERRLFEAESLSASLDEQVKKLREEAWKTSERQRAAEDEARSLRMQMELLSSSEGLATDEDRNKDRNKDTDRDGDRSGRDADDDEVEEDAFFVGNAATLRQRLRDTRRQLRQLQRQLDPTTTTTTDTTTSQQQNEAHVLAMQQEIEDVKRQKREREDLIATLRRQSAEAEHERDALRHQLADRAHVDSNASRDAAQRLGVLASTVQRLEERLTERELLVTRLETEKNKLEAYAKRSLMAFKEKFMAVIQTMREEKRELEAKVKAQAERTERAQDAWRREERLLSAALFEVGVKIMDRKIHANLSQQQSQSQSHGNSNSNSNSSSSSTPGTESFLAAQREAVSRASTINVQHAHLQQQQQQQTQASYSSGTPAGADASSTMTMMSPEAPSSSSAGRRLFNHTPGN